MGVLLELLIERLFLAFEYPNLNLYDVKMICYDDLTVKSSNSVPEIPNHHYGSTVCFVSLNRIGLLLLFSTTFVDVYPQSLCPCCLVRFLSPQEPLLLLLLGLVFF